MINDNNQKQWNQAEVMKLLDNLFKNDISDTQKENAFADIKKNLGKLNKIKF